MRRPGETVYVRRVGYAMFALTAQRERGRKILRELFGGSGNTWIDDSLFIDHRYIYTVIEAVGDRIKFEGAS